MDNKPDERFYEEFTGIWTCSSCDGAVSEDTLRSLEQQGMLHKCPRCGVDVTTVGLDTSVDVDDQSVSFLGRIIESFK